MSKSHPDFSSNDYYPHRPHEEPWTPPLEKKRQWETVKPKPITIFDVFPHLGRMTIGWSPILDSLKQITAEKPAYPPYDIVKTDEDTNLLNVAVAGFFKQELSVTVEDGILVITGKKGKKNKTEGEVLYQGIAARDFTLRLAIAEYWRVNGAALNNGLLTVTFQKELPEEKKPKVIDIK